MLCGSVALPAEGSTTLERVFGLIDAWTLDFALACLLTDAWAMKKERLPASYCQVAFLALVVFSTLLGAPLRLRVGSTSECLLQQVPSPASRTR